MNASEIIAEFRKKYEGCYMHVQMPDSNEDNLFLLTAVVHERGTSTGVLKLESEEFGKIQLNMGTAHTLKFKFPKVGVFQYGTDAYLFYRCPRRQWRRGLCNENAKIFPVWTGIRGGSRGLGGFDFATIEAAFKGMFYTYKEAIKMLQGGKYRSVALANSFSVVLSTIQEYPYIMLYRTLPVARLDEQGSILSMIEPSFDLQIKQIVQ